MSASRIGVELYAGTCVVSQVLPGGSAASAGIVPGDSITVLADRKVASEADIDGVLASIASGTVIPIQCERSGRAFTVAVMALGAPTAARPAPTPSPTPLPLQSPPPPVSATPVAASAVAVESSPSPTPKSRRGLVIGIVVAVVAVVVVLGFLLVRTLSSVAGHSESYQAGQKVGQTYREALSPSDFDMATSLVPPNLTCQGLQTAWILEHGSVPGGDQNQWLSGCTAALA